MDQKTIRKLVDYDPETGVFCWRPRQREDFKEMRDCRVFNTRFAGKQMGTVDGKGYLHMKYRGKFYRLHRMAWLYVHGTLPAVVDHINRDPKDNRIANLRATDVSGNNLNRSANKTGRKTSKYKGVSRHTNGRWQAQTKVKGKQTHLGLYDTEEEAFDAYLSFMRKTHGEGYFL